MSIFDLFRRKKEAPRSEKPQSKTTKPNAGKEFKVAYTAGIPSIADMQAVARGMKKTVMVGMACGGCGKEWKDSVTPNKETRVTCPHCGGINKITLNAGIA